MLFDAAKRPLVVAPFVTKDPFTDFSNSKGVVRWEAEYTIWAPFPRKKLHVENLPAILKTCIVRATANISEVLHLKLIYILAFSNPLLLLRICISQEVNAINLLAPASPGKLLFAAEKGDRYISFFFWLLSIWEHLTKILKETRTAIQN